MRKLIISLAAAAAIASAAAPALAQAAPAHAPAQAAASHFWRPAPGGDCGDCYDL
jgi:hypothetical protein